MNQASNCLDRHGFNEANESTGLLCDDEERTAGSLSTPESTSIPLPKAQLTALIIADIVDPIAHLQIFPYINQRLSDLRVAPPEKVGFYSGFIESAYSLAHMLSVYHWGRLSDIIGRRPVVMLTLMGITITTICFGMSESFLTLLASRFVGGLVAGNNAVLHSILVEISDDTNQNIAVPIYSLSLSTGSIIGSLIGGTFANAATRYPNHFSRPMFLDHPYLPPCLISAVCALLGVVTGYFFIKETLPTPRKDLFSVIFGRPYTSTSDMGSETETKYASLKGLLMIPTLRTLILSGFTISILSTSFNVLFALFCYSSLDAGGLGLPPSDIGNLLAFANAFSFLIRLVVMPYILYHFDYATIYSTCTCLWPLVFASPPILNALALLLLPLRSGTLFANGFRTTSTRAEEIIVWIYLALILAMAKVAAIPFSITMLLVKRHTSALCAPERTVDNSDPECDHHSEPTSGSTPTAEPEGRPALGQSNGLMQLSLSLGRAIGPVFSSTLFTALNGSMWARSWSIGWAWSLVMVCLAVVGARLARNIQ